MATTANLAGVSNIQNGIKLMVQGMGMMKNYLVVLNGLVIFVGIALLAWNLPDWIDEVLKKNP